MRCAFVHPEVFDIDDNGDPVADAPPDRLSDEDMISLAKVCPNEAIVVERSGTYLVGGTD
jgi:ferredoxin